MADATVRVGSLVPRSWPKRGVSQAQSDAMRGRVQRIAPGRMSLVLVCCIVAIITFLDARSLAAQAEAGNQELGRLVGGALRVQLSVRGIDSTQWFHGRVMRTTTGCTHIQVLNGRWIGGQLLPDSTTVPPAQRISAPLRSLHRIQTTPHGVVPDTVGAWTDVPLDTLLLREPAACQPDR